MFVDINWYGQLSVLTKYLKTNIKIPFASIQHGYITTNDFDISGPRKLKAVPYLVWNKKIENYFQSKKDYNVKAIGAPFIYIKDKKIKKPKGSMLMLIHSENTLKQEIVSKLFLRKIKKYYPAPHKISLFYKYYNNKNINYYKNQGFEVLTFGSRNNTNHLSKLYKTLNEIECFITDYVGSPFFYALYLKKKTKLIQNQYKYNTDLSMKKFYNRFMWLKKRERYKFCKKFYNSKFIPQKAGYKIACEELGVKCLKTKSELFKLLGYDSLWKKIIAKIALNIRPKSLYYKTLLK